MNRRSVTLLARRTRSELASRASSSRMLQRLQLERSCPFQSGRVKFGKSKVKKRLEYYEVELTYIFVCDPVVKKRIIVGVISPS